MVEFFNALAALFSLVGVGAPQNFVFEDSLKIDAIVEVANSSLVEIPSNYKELLCEKPIYNFLGADRYRLIKFQSNYGIYDIQEEMLIKILSYEQFECLNIDSVIFFFPNDKCSFIYFDRTSAINPVKLIDLVNDVELSTDRYNQDNFAFHFSKNNLTKFRFYSTSDALGDRNKGRLSIGDMVIFYET